MKKFFRIAKHAPRMNTDNPRVLAISDMEGQFESPSTAVAKIARRLYSQYDRRSLGKVSQDKNTMSSRILSHLPFKLSMEEVEKATIRLSWNKAVGIDGFPDLTIHALARLVNEDKSKTSLDFFL